MSAESTSTTEPPVPAKSPPSSFRRYLPRRGVWITWGISIVLVGLARFYDEHLDMAVVNGVTAGGIFACGLSLFIWFVWHSGFEFVTRRIGFLLVLLGLLLVIGCVRVKYDGGLNPYFRFAWTPLPDQILEAPKTHQPADIKSAPPLSKEIGFPQFLGPDRNSVVTGPRLITDWQAHPPVLKWGQRVGAGWAAFAAHSGRAVTLEQYGEEECVVCYDIATGKTLWSHAVLGRHTEAMGHVGPRSTPTIDPDSGLVFTLGANGHLHCIDLMTGNLVWKQQLLDVIGVKDPTEDQKSILWGRASSPLIYKDLMIIPGGGPANGAKVSLVAFDKRTGVPKWTGGSSQVSYSSPTLATLHGTEQILIVNEASVAGHDPATGKELWNFPWFGSSSAMASVSQPHAVNDHQVFISKGYGGGMKLLEIAHAEATDEWSVEVVEENSAAMKTKFSNVAILGNYAYALSDSILECVDWRSGESQWKNGRYGQGQLLAVNDLLLIQCESGEVALVQATPEKHVELTRFPAIKEAIQDPIVGITWNNPCLYGRLLLVRNDEVAACYELPVVAGEMQEASGGRQDVGRAR